MDMSTPLFLKIDFRIRLNSMKKKVGGGGRFWLLWDRYSFPFVYNSVISRSRLVCVACNKPYGILFLRQLKYSPIFV